MSIKATARRAVIAAFEAAGDAKVRIELRLGPIEDAYDPEADTSERSWEQVKRMDAIAYNETNGREITINIAGGGQAAGEDQETRTRSFIVKGAEITAARPNQEGEVLEVKENILWQISKLEADPTRSVWIIHCKG